MANFNRDDVIKGLKEAVCEIHFTKVNGESRIMRCSLDPRYVKAPIDVNHLDEQHKRPENKNTVVCWDVVAGGWRSFRIDSVQYMQEIDGY